MKKESDASPIFKPNVELMKQKTLLVRALTCLEYVTYHDGRYKQSEAHDWMTEAQHLVQDLASHLNVKAYKGYGPRG